MYDVLVAIVETFRSMPAWDIAGPVALGAACCTSVKLPYLPRKVPMVPLPALHLLLVVGWLVCAFLLEAGAFSGHDVDIVAYALGLVVIWRYISRRRALVTWFRMVALRLPA